MGLEGVKVGDRVWQGSRPLGTFYPKRDLHEVVTVTPTGFRVKGRPKDLFSKKTGKDYRSSDYRYHAIATLAECQAWDAKQAQIRAAQQEQERQKQVAEARRTQLRELFPPDTETNVRDAEWSNHKGRYDVVFRGLSETEVRALAVKINV